MEIVEHYRYIRKSDGREYALKWLSGIGLNKSVIATIVELFDLGVLHA